METPQTLGRDKKNIQASREAQATSEQSTSKQTLKHRGPRSTSNGRASKTLLQKFLNHGPWNKFHGPLTMDGGDLYLYMSNSLFKRRSHSNFRQTLIYSYIALPVIELIAQIVQVSSMIFSKIMSCVNLLAFQTEINT